MHGGAFKSFSLVEAGSRPLLTVPHSPAQARSGPIRRGPLTSLEQIILKIKVIPPTPILLKELNVTTDVKSLIQCAAQSNLS